MLCLCSRPAVHTQVNLLGQPGTILKHRISCLPRTQLAPEAVQRPPNQETKATGKDAVGNQRPSWRLVQTQTQKKQQHTCHAAKKQCLRSDPGMYIGFRANRNALGNNEVCKLIWECTSGSGQIAACWKAERHHISRRRIWRTTKGTTQHFGLNMVENSTGISACCTSRLNTGALRKTTSAGERRNQPLLTAWWYPSDPQ